MATKRASAGAAASVAALVIAAGVGAGAYFLGHSAAKGATPTVTVGSKGVAASSATITPAPAFSTNDLAADPTTDWITNGGSLMNQRYSPLDELTTANVKSLKGIWHVHLRGSGAAAKYSQEAQPLAYKGVIYVPTGADDVFAVDATSGKILWQYKGNLDPSISTVCCGWLSRGVALGDGKVYLGKLDGSLVALDQQTGKQVWRTVVMPWQQGYTITNAPLYWNGLVITGVSGGEFGIRGRVTAYDAKTGKEAWRFYTTEPASWGGNAYTHGGAPVWHTPSLDPSTGLLYFSTGNASPDLDGSKRPGDNLYAASIVAIDAKTGTLKWYYQMVHHDIWDYDAPSPTVLFDATINGTTRHLIGESEKTGWVYLLDRTDGKPVLPIPEKPVPQLPQQKTAATQPIPSYASVIPHKPSPADIAAVKKIAASTAAKTAASAKTSKAPQVVGAPDIYTPFWKDKIVVNVPGPQGGNNFQPASYNPNTQMMYVCEQAAPSGYLAETAKAKGKQGKVKSQEVGSVFVTDGFGANPGYFAAVDVTSGKIAWSHRWAESCYSGTVTTKGNLVFVGRNSGALQAYDAKTGKLVWSFQTGAGANTTPTIFQQDGHEVVAFAAGGNALAATPHGDNLWLFGLQGKLGPAKAPGGGQGVGHAGETQKKTSTKAGDPKAGKAVFSQNCSGCHGATGHGGNGGPDLSALPASRSVVKVVAQVENGGPGMPPFKGTLTQKQIRDVAAYVTKVVAKSK